MPPDNSHMYFEEHIINLYYAIQYKSQCGYVIAGGDFNELY